MHKLTFSFKVLSMCGVWLPVDWTSPRHIFYYKIFSCIMVFASYAIATLQCLLLSVTEFDFSFIAEILFTFLSSVTICTKSINFILRRPHIVRLADMLLFGCCLPRDKKEAAIQKQCDEFIRYFQIVRQVLVLFLFSVLECFLKDDLCQALKKKKECLYGFVCKKFIRLIIMSSHCTILLIEKLCCIF